MFERLKRLYGQGKLTDAGLDAAVARGWLSETQAEEIRGKQEGTAAG